MSDGDSLDLPGPPESASTEETLSQFAGDLVNRLFAIGLSLNDARSSVGHGQADNRIIATTDEVDRLIRDIRTAAFSLLVDRPAALRARMLRVAVAMQRNALHTVAVLDEASSTRPPVRLDYLTEIKRWRAFADQAEQMARRWEQRL
jgi:hypothetical protein